MINDEVFNVTTVRNYKEFIERILKIDVPIDYLEADKSLWKMLQDMLHGAKVFQNL